MRPDIASSADKESEKMMNFSLPEAWINSSAWLRAVSSAVYTELSVGMRWLDSLTSHVSRTAGAVTPFSDFEPSVKIF